MAADDPGWDTPGDPGNTLPQDPEAPPQDYPDDPPVEDPPIFDQIGNVALKYKCAGENSRNTFILAQKGKQQCRIIRTVTGTIITNTAYYRPSCRPAPWHIPANYFKGYKACTSNPSIVDVTDVQLGYMKNTIPSCKPAQLYTFDGAAFVVKCNVRAYIPKQNLRGTMAAECHFSGKLARNNQIVRHICRVIRTNSEVPPATRIRKICGIYAPRYDTLDKPCFRWGMSLPIVDNVFTYNITSCRPSQILDYASYTFETACKTFAITPDVVLAEGSINPHPGTFQCRSYPVFVQTFDGHRGVCGNEKLLFSTSLTYKIFTCRWTKKAPEVRPGRIMWCGNMVFGFSDALIFGRIWGGRDPLVYVKRESGRLIGKIRPE